MWLDSSVIVMVMEILGLTSQVMMTMCDWRFLESGPAGKGPCHEDELHQERITVEF